MMEPYRITCFKEDSAIEFAAERVVDIWKSRPAYLIGSRSCYDSRTNTIYLNFPKPCSSTKKFKFLHEISHMVQNELGRLTRRSREEIELEADSIAMRAMEMLGFAIPKRILRKKQNKLRE